MDTVPGLFEELTPERRLEINDRIARIQVDTGARRLVLTDYYLYLRLGLETPPNGLILLISIQNDVSYLLGLHELAYLPDRLFKFCEYYYLFISEIFDYLPQYK